MPLSSSYSGLLTRLYRRLWLGRVRSDTPAIPRGSLILAAHYNGAIDGFTYGSQLPEFVAVVSVQWHRHLLGRWLLPGIAVKRAKDQGSAGGNLTAFREMTARLRAGERLLFFPEGTSRLGTERLPIGRGTLLLLRGLRSSGRSPSVYFTAAHYHQPTRWRSNVSLGWIGPVALPPTTNEDEAWIRDHLLQAQAAAYASPVPPAYRCTWLAGLIALPFLPVWWATSGLARRIADEENVVALWKFIVGVPATGLALAVYTIAASLCSVPWWAPLASLAGGWLLWSR